MADFQVRDRFYLDGKPFQIISGGIHYFRVPAAYWADRLQKLKALGCNTVETYVAWNVHEPRQGEYVFGGEADLVRFLRLAQEMGLYAIVRPSPYICAEWEFGGLPGWLLAIAGMRIRSSEGPFLLYVRRYYERLLPLLTPLQIDRGGNILLMQVENEYGYYGDDRKYLEALRDMMRALDVTVPLITSDGPMDDQLFCGSVDGALPTANFGSRTDERLDILRRHVEVGPLMCAEYWVGWFDYWGGRHQRTDAQESAREFEKLLRRGSANIYMFHGGTNFGFMNGANDYDALTPDVTSYDYDALLTEDGRITPKYEAFRSVIAEFLPEGDAPPPAPAPLARKGYGMVKAEAAAPLFASLAQIAEPLPSLYPKSMEALGESYGYVLYHTTLPEETEIEKFRLYRANDRAQVFWNGAHALTLYDRALLLEHPVAWRQPKGASLDILVENMGRVNFGVRMQEQWKGIAGEVVLGGRVKTGWTQYTLPMTDKMLARVPFGGPDTAGDGPAFFRFTLHVDACADTFLDMTGWGKGCAFVNGRALGRFWDIGPQRRLYVPGPFLRKGSNEIIVFETEGKRSGTLTFWDEADLGDEAPGGEENA